MQRYIPYGRQYIDEEDIKAVEEVLRSDFLTTGPKVQEFEQCFARYVGTKYAVAVANGTAALHAACMAAGVGSGDEVITTPMTFAASANSVIYCGGKPVFADIRSDTYTIDPEDVEKKITKKTKAIIPVHYTGQPCDMDEIQKIAKRHGLTVIEDSAHALGACYKGRPVGSISDMSTFSFHPVKHITTGEGGMITTNNQTLYQKMKMFLSHGITRSSESMRWASSDGWYYEQLFLGYNYRLTDIQSALGISQMKKLDDFIARRRHIAEMYNRGFADLKGIVLPFQPEYSQSAVHIYVLRVRREMAGKSRKEVFDFLRSKGLGVNVHYIPVYYFPYYQKLGYQKGLCPNAEQHYDECLTIPLYPMMTEEEVNYVIGTVRELFA